MPFILSIFIIILSTFAHAKEINLSNQKFAVYVRGTYGLSLMGKDAYNDSSGTGTSFTDTVEYNQSGEIGFFVTQGTLGFRAGFEILSTQQLENIEGQNASNVLQTTLDSEVRASILKAGLEFNLFSNAYSKAYMLLSVGTANLELINAYDDADNSPADFTNFVDSTVLMGDLLFGYEIIIADNATFMIDLGYRSFKVPELEYDRAITNYQGSQTTGSAFKDNSGNNISFDMGGYFAGAGIRIYLDL